MGKGARILTAGVVSTVVMVFILLLLDIETRSQLSLFEAIARFFGMPGRTGLAFVVFVVFGVVVWPVLFAVVDPYLPFGHDSALSGMLFASALWLAFILIGTAELRAILLPFYVAVTLFAHLSYGFTLGLVFGWTAWASDSTTTDIETDIGDSD